MHNRMSPLQIGLAVGVPIGLLLAALSMLTGISESAGTLAGVLDASFAFLFGAVLAGGIAAFIQWRRTARALGDAAPPGWYDSPDEDGTQWFWSGTRWTDRTRATPPRLQPRRF